MRIVAGGFAIGGLAPGDYVMRMIVSVDGKVAGTALRTMRKVKEEGTADKGGYGTRLIVVLVSTLNFRKFA